MHMGLFFNHIKRIAFFSLFILFIQGCSKEDRHPVPLVPVEFRINTEFQYIELNSIGGWVNVYGGFGGIVIYRMSVDEFTAFDRACPVHPYDQEARLVVEDPPIARCNVCESTYLLLDGSPVSGPARHPLRQYRTVYSEPYLFVTNY
ncbi:MAG: hypothetical protein EA361_06415 [Bacteroidetes bacterium]|nr:MAG: hypothetical protein EA361_06415 [Bacteroidota bacterium]